MLKRKQWTIAKLQRPPAAHIAITDASSANYQDFIDSVRECVKAMKDDPSLNVNHDTAMYGMTGSIPDNNFMRKFVCIHQAAMLDTLE